MGPFQEYEEKKSPEKGSPPSRIPRLVLHPSPPKDKASPQSDSPFSEEDGKECDISSDHSKRTISNNSFCSDDTGCPTSQSVSPSKTPSGSEQSAHSSPTLPERKAKVKRVRVMAEGSGDPRSAQRHKREMRSAMKARGSEADFSSSSSTGSLKTREGLTTNSVGKKTLSRSRCGHIRPLPVFKPAGSLTANRDAELYAPYRTPPRPASSTNSSSNSSPTSRRANLGHYHSCGDNHGIRPPNPEQYLTPLQQKEVAIRHLKTNLLDSENRVHDRETEVEELKVQLGRMREDWIEEECHRVEAQLSLKEARKEIKQLRQVVETMKSSLMEKDKGIQKYFIDINIQNRKLESLLQSMELAQSGTSLQDETTLDFICDSPERGGKKMEGEEEVVLGELGNQGEEAMADSGLLFNDEMANRADILEQVFMSTAVDFSQDSIANLRAEAAPEVSTLIEEEQLFESTAPTTAPPNAVSTTIDIISIRPSQQTTEDKTIQTDTMNMSPDLQSLLLQLLKFHGSTAGNTALSASSNLQGLTHLPNPTPNTDLPDFSLHPTGVPIPVHPESPDTSTDSGMCCSEPVQSRRFMEELDFAVNEKEPCLSPGLDVVGKSYWSNSFLVDLVAVAAPVLPTVAWLYSRHGVDGSSPVYNIAALIRGCCIMGLHSLRHVTHRPNA